jgi:hypothetical protein
MFVAELLAHQQSRLNSKSGQESWGLRVQESLVATAYEGTLRTKVGIELTRPERQVNSSNHKINVITTVCYVGHQSAACQ